MRTRKPWSLSFSMCACLGVSLGMVFSARAQTTAPLEWTWVGGSATVPATNFPPAVYGALGVPSPGNTPGGRDSAATWTDGNGRFWLFGGNIDTGNTYVLLNDLWQLNPSTNQWTWMGGDDSEPCPGQACGNAGVYGVLGNPAAGNLPGGRYAASSWVDTSGHFWLFGGLGFDASGTLRWLNDLWEFNPSTNQWAWMGGDNTPPSSCHQNVNCTPAGVYGTLGTPAPGNIPGGRIGASSWTGSNGHLWLFGGLGFGQQNDLWEFNPSTNEWTWRGGSIANVGSTFAPTGVYGTLGQFAPGNIPSGRVYATSWIDASGHFWLSGGLSQVDDNHVFYLNDLWEFDPSTNQWAWMGGSDTATNCNSQMCGPSGVYGTQGIAAGGNQPGGRIFATGWTDSVGDLWLFGGTGIDSSGAVGVLNDLWEFNPSTRNWAWMNGSSTVPGYLDGQPGVYGTLGVPAKGNTPGGRNSAAGWTDTQGNLWLFGGGGPEAVGNTSVPPAILNDVWEYQPHAIAAVPTFSVPAGTYNAVQTVTISDATAGATIYYTTNGSTPTASSTVYSGPITVSSSETLEAIATSSADLASAVASAAYTIALPGFSVSSTTVAVAPGATTGNTATITLTPANGFTGSVALSAAITASPAGAQSPPTFSFGTSTPANITGAGAATATLTITTTAGGGCTQLAQARGGLPWYAGGAALACILLMGIPARRRTLLRTVGQLALLASLMGGLAACGGSGTSSTCTVVIPGTTPGAYTVTVTGTSGKLTETGAFTLTVQ